MKGASEFKMALLKLLMFTLYISSVTTELASATTFTTTATTLNNQKTASKPQGAAKRMEIFQSKLETIKTTLRPTTNESTVSMDTSANELANKSQDRQPEASLLRPLFIRGLLGSHKQRPGEQSEDEMEEVSQTIMVPMDQSSGSDSNSGGGGRRSKSHRSSRTGGHLNNVLPESIQESSVPTIMSSQSASSHHNRANAKGPLAEASLQLTSTEIGSLLNDREAPEFYRERELNGDGVLVGEEPASRATSVSNSRLGRAASGPYGTHYMGDYGPSGAGFGGNGFGGGGEGFDGGENAAAIYRQRLMQAASEDGYGGGAGGGFNQRFGQQSFGGGGDELGMGHGGGSRHADGSGLMQSPNEFNQVNSYQSGFGGEANYMGSQGQYHGTGAGEFSPNSGLLRAGSEGPFGSSFNQNLLSTGGGGEFNGAGMGDFSGAGQSSFYGAGDQGQGRLQAHASYNPYLASTSEGDFASRFGYQGPGLASAGSSFGLEQRGFASHNNHQIMSHRLNQAASGGGVGGGRLHRLMPLTPVVPLAEELAGNGVTQPSVMSSNQRDQVVSSPNSITRGQHQVGLNGPSFQTNDQNHQQQIHEALEEDPTDVSQADETTEANKGEQRDFENNFEASTPSSSNVNEMNRLMSLSKREQAAASKSTASGFPSSFVLNVPPPSSEQFQHSSFSPSTTAKRRGLTQQQMVEFSRVGSAGYLAPSAFNQNSHQDRNSMMMRKFGHQHRGGNQLMNSDDSSDQSSDDSDATSSADEESSSSVTSSTGVDNPAHAGKYIID